MGFTKRAIFARPPSRGQVRPSECFVILRRFGVGKGAFFQRGPRLQRGTNTESLCGLCSPPMCGGVPLPTRAGIARARWQPSTGVATDFALL